MSEPHADTRPHARVVEIFESVGHRTLEAGNCDEALLVPEDPTSTCP